MAPDLTVADADALDCGVCCLPLKPPIFQCDVGHVVCAPCRDKLDGKGKCHVCGVAMAGGYRRCHAMERVVDSVRAPCPNAAHGCDAMPPHHALEDHFLACPHGSPCHCPGEACGFAGSTAALLDHFRAAHGWPCTAEVDANDRGEYTVRLHDGFNFLLADGNKMLEGATAPVRCLLLLNVVRQPLGRSVSVICIDPHAAAAGGPASKEMKCTLSYSRPFQRYAGSDQLLGHCQTSTFRVACTDLSNGIPNPDGCFQFLLQNSVIIADNVKDGIIVIVRIFIRY